MDFLKNEFIDQLRAEIDNATGNVVIQGIPFTPQKILEFDKVAQDAAFFEWSDCRNRQWLEKADEILACYDNRDRFDKLTQAYSRGKVWPFVGAGLSVSSGYPGWTEYLYSLCEETLIPETDLMSCIDCGKYEEAAQLLFDEMRPASFNEHIENTFEKNTEPDGCVRFLPYCFPQSNVITTNFDDILKQCYQTAGKSFSQEILGSDASELRRYIGQGRNFLLKLHGKASHKRILTKNEYDQHYSDGTMLENCIEAIANNTLLFLGCSLRADRTIKSLKKLIIDRGQGSMARHYAFLATDNDKAERLKRKDELAEANIFPIWYSADDDHDECLMALLVKLKQNLPGNA